MDHPYQHFVGRTRQIGDRIGPLALRRMAALMGWPEPIPPERMPLPPLWHWLLGAPPITSADTGEDGHERLGLFLPDFPESVRMWASGDVTFHGDLAAGDEVTVHTTIAAITPKHGRSGALWFVELTHEHLTAGCLAISERQTLVYRPLNRDSVPTRAQPEPAHEGALLAQYRINDTQMFRYSALTYNSHRIHLDRDYCQAYEGDRRLVVHGPLLATILARSAAEFLGRPLRGFAFRAHYPVREDEAISVYAAHLADGGCQIWVADKAGGLRMSATAS